jgi:steroid 5-alpha reductase family enzyme
MTAVIAIRIAEAWSVAAALQAILWLVAQRTKNAGIVDVGWALSFALVIVLFGWRATVSPTAWAPLAGIVVAWSVRLGGHLIARGAASGPEEGRYADLRARWAPHASRKFFVFFQAQAALTGVLSAAMAVPFVVAPIPALAPLRYAGLAIAILAVAGETLADAQLSGWKREPANQGIPCEAGLWRYSRHPNYFFEWCVWIGYAIYGLAFAPWGLLALLGQAVIFGSIWGVTGIPPTEAQSLRSKGAKYRAYQERVSKFVPLPPKKRGAMTQTR